MKEAANNPLLSEHLLFKLNPIYLLEVLTSEDGKELSKRE